jgi:hypothetical protein
LLVNDILMINCSGQFAVTMIHDGLMRDLMKARPRQDMAFIRRIGSIVKAHIPAKNKRVIIFSDEENSPSDSPNEDHTAKNKRVIIFSDEENSPSDSPNEDHTAKKKRHIIFSDEENSPSDTPIFEVGSDTCALCEGLAKVFVYRLLLYSYHNIFCNEIFIHRLHMWMDFPIVAIAATRLQMPKYWLRLPPRSQMHRALPRLVCAKFAISSARYLFIMNMICLLILSNGAGCGIS